MSFTARMSSFLGRTFTLWVLAFALLAYRLPAEFARIAPHVPLLLGIIMFGMGLTLTVNDFKGVLTMPKSVAVGVVAQFVIMPALAFGLALLFRLPPDLAVGVILVGCCPGGTASNVITYLARGNTALSVTMTACSTLLAPIVTPLLIWLLAGRWLDIAAGAMFWAILKIVLLPVLLGLVLRLLFPRFVTRQLDLMPIISITGIILVVAAVVAVNQKNLATSGLLVLGVVMLHNILGLVLGYFAARVMKLGYPERKAISIEVGMQNSGLGATLAIVYFSPIAAIPSAIFSVWHNLSGPALATWWRRESR
ncbi:MAG: bile acid:sodium symporter family protein [Kiritimatiellae bacterium]|nr:bile acid:sodium symporter family protein [Kiritimatiellia bacterium]